MDISSSIVETAKIQPNEDIIMSPTANTMLMEGSALKDLGPEGLNMSAIKENGMNDPNKLMLTPRRVSGREKKNISYKTLHTGAADSDDEDMMKDNALGGSMSKVKN